MKGLGISEYTSEVMESSCVFGCVVSGERDERCDKQRNNRDVKSSSRSITGKFNISSDA